MAFFLILGRRVNIDLVGKLAKLVFQPCPSFSVQEMLLAKLLRYVANI